MVSFVGQFGLHLETRLLIVQPGLAAGFTRQLGSQGKGKKMGINKGY